MTNDIKVLVAGALGKMGRETVRALKNSRELSLAGAADVKSRGLKIAAITGDDGDQEMIYVDLEEALTSVKPKVMVDFTNPQSVFNNACLALQRGVHCIIGTTGLNQNELKALEQQARENKVAAAVIPNFALGAILMMKFASEAASYFPHAEIIELHHDEKLDAPSGTAIKTAELISESRVDQVPHIKGEFEKYSGARGGRIHDVPVHSVRLPGLVAHQEVVFGGPGQILTIKHDALNRECYMPGVILSIQKITAMTGLVLGLESFL
jgi:4-hydroxy-tetrahydrodipicolinate reductase